MAYTADKPKPALTSAELRARIPGWGVDLDPRDRPAVPKERFDPGGTGAHWDFPERQEEKWPRERSIEHEFLTPVFGTSCPPKGLSGVMRKFAFRYSEARAAHWLILLAADRVDAVESHLASFLTLHPDNPVTETGIRSELSHHGVSSRLGKKRADLSHLWMDPIIVAAPWVLSAAGVAYTVTGVLQKFRRG
ncbi:hypothetical protein [Rhodococcus tibetensis]|uniref:Uncharacterized protein n=1 Tax=Rhodococcus tibetensis TaxID=2965064 RepID=A0ABT1QH49_9NOCA|nr:hypothetical protein [Rhodococcus sp. FXJ9.536]MCQ4121611.1 hypothetical protein [Rhodococcus sp. FXJ9.536]